MGVFIRFCLRKWNRILEMVITTFAELINTCKYLLVLTITPNNYISVLFTVLAYIIKHNQKSTIICRSLFNLGNYNSVGC